MLQPATGMQRCCTWTGCQCFEPSELSDVLLQVDEVKNIMVDNIEKVRQVPCKTCQWMDATHCGSTREAPLLRVSSSASVVGGWKTRAAAEGPAASLPMPATLSAPESQRAGCRLRVVLQVLERGEKIELLVDKTDNLRFQVGLRFLLQGQQSGDQQGGDRAAHGHAARFCASSPGIRTHMRGELSFRS